MKKVCVVGANGCVGRFFIQLFEAMGYDVLSVDPGFAEAELTDTKLRIDLLAEQAQSIQSLLGEMDVLVFALSTQVLMQIVPHILGALIHEPLLVDTTSTKELVFSFYQGLFSSVRSFEVFSCDPLFKPSKDITQGNMAYFTMNPTEYSEVLSQQIIAQGIYCFECQPKEHDLALSTVQVLLHSVALALASTAEKSGIDLETLQAFSTPPFRMVLIIMQRILSGEAEVYWEIQADNFGAADARDAFMKEYRALGDMISLDRPDQFSDYFSRLENFALPSNKRDALSQIFADINQLTIQYVEDE